MPNHVNIMHVIQLSNIKPLYLSIYQYLNMLFVPLAEAQGEEYWRTCVAHSDVSQRTPHRTSGYYRAC